MWYSYDDIKVFQALEFKTHDVTIELSGKTYFPVRYVHAEYYMQNKCFRHFDGALQFFSEKQYYQRRDKNFNEKTKGEYQTKSKSQNYLKSTDV